VMNLPKEEVENVVAGAVCVNEGVSVADGDDEDDVASAESDYVEIESEEAEVEVGEQALRFHHVR